MKIKNKSNNIAPHKIYNGAIFLVLGVITSIFAACVDEDIAKENNKNNNKIVSFNVIDVQESILAADNTGITRGLTAVPVSSAELESERLPVTGTDTYDLCLVHSTIEGVNPIKVEPGTRANEITRATLGKFSSLGYRGSSDLSISTTPNWFYNEQTNADGTLVKRYSWDWILNTHARFYSVYPEAKTTNGIILSPESYSGNPYVDFTVNNDVKKQVDLMTACSGTVTYNPGVDPKTDLKFRHALAAIRFSVGSNLSPKRITKVEIRNAIVKGRYTLADNLNGTRPSPTDNGWTINDGTADRGTVTLSGVNINPYATSNAYIMGNPNDNFTFLMIPQKLKDKNVQIYIEFNNNPSDHILSTLKDGEWKVGTTHDYKLSQKNSSWEYKLTVTPNITFKYNQNTSLQYSVTSYRQGGGYSKPVGWKVIKYEESSDGGATWIDKGLNKPDWITDLNKTEGTGGTWYEYGAAKVRTDMTDKLIPYNNELKTATPKGSPGSPWNLANPNDGSDYIVESANSYLISAPGFYRIPLVYGNAVKNNSTNITAYNSSAPVVKDSWTTGHNLDLVLHTFIDHKGQPISSPYINDNRGGNERASQASIIWSDQPNLITLAANPIKNYGGRDFVEFEITRDNIRNGNAVIAVKNTVGSGIVMWSWHIWVDHKDALDVIPCKNYQGTVYKFSRNVLGFARIKWNETTYNQARKVRVTIGQELGNRTKKSPNEGIAQMIITQETGYENIFAPTLYQFGRKDAFPGTNDTYPSNAILRSKDLSRITEAITRPNYFPMGVANNQYFYHWCYPTYQNLWDMNFGSSDRYAPHNPSDLPPFIKTIYDPCPAGFHVPDNYAFTGFVENGLVSGNANVIGDFKDGYDFKTGFSSPNTIFIPASGWRTSEPARSLPAGDVTFKEQGRYWTAIPKYRGEGQTFEFRSEKHLTYSQSRGSGAHGFGVCPVAF